MAVSGEVASSLFFARYFLLSIGAFYCYLAMFTLPLQGVCCCVSLRLPRTLRRDGFPLSYVSDSTIGSKEVSRLGLEPGT